MDVLDAMKNLCLEPENKGTQSLKSVSADIDGVNTEIVLSEYPDRTVIILSQYLKIGSLLFVQREQVQNSLVSNDIYSTRVVFGATGEEPQVAARYLAEEIKIQNSLYIFLSLKSYDIETVKACKDIILDLQQRKAI